LNTQWPGPLTAGVRPLNAFKVSGVSRKMLIRHVSNLALSVLLTLFMTLHGYAQTVSGGTATGGSSSFSLATMEVYQQYGVQLNSTSSNGCVNVTPTLAPGSSYGEFAYSLDTTDGLESVLVHGTVYSDGSVNAAVEYANVTSANDYFSSPAASSSQEGWRGFWADYWYYLTNPSAMDDDLETGFYVAMGTAAVAGTAAGGFAIAGVNPVLWGGGATVATGAATGTVAVETATIEGITYEVVTINSAYPGTVLVPNGWSICFGSA